MLFKISHNAIKQSTNIDYKHKNKESTVDKLLLYLLQVKNNDKKHKDKISPSRQSFVNKLKHYITITSIQRYHIRICGQ